MENIKKKIIIFFVSLIIIFLISYLLFIGPSSGKGEWLGLIVICVILSLTISITISYNIFITLTICLAILVGGQYLWLLIAKPRLADGAGFGFALGIILGVISSLAISLVINPLIKKFYLKDK